MVDQPAIPRFRFRHLIEVPANLHACLMHDMRQIPDFIVSLEGRHRRERAGRRGGLNHFREIDQGVGNRARDQVQGRGHQSKRQEASDPNHQERGGLLFVHLRQSGGDSLLFKPIKLRHQPANPHHDFQPPALFEIRHRALARAGFHNLNKRLCVLDKLMR